MKKVVLFATLLMVWCAYEAHLHPYSSSTETESAGSKPSTYRVPSPIPASSLSDPSLATAPTLQNSEDSQCRDAEYNSHPCTDVEISSAQGEFQTRWNTLPEWLRKKCLSFTTLKSQANCEATETVEFLRLHPGADAPWEGFTK